MATYTPQQLAELANQYWYANNPQAYQDLIRPYLGQQVQTQNALISGGEGQAANYTQFLNPLTGAWEGDPNQNLAPTSTASAGGGIAPWDWEATPASTSLQVLGFNLKNGDSWDISPYFTYNQGADGNWTVGDGGYNSVYDTGDSLKSDDYATSLAVLAGGYLAGGALSGAGYGAGAAGGAGTVGGSGAFLGEGALSGVPAWDGALANAGAAGAAGTAGATFNPAVDSQLANQAIDAAGGNALSGYATAAIPGATTGLTSAVSSGLSNLVPSGLSSLLGPAATALGALGGAQGTQSGGTSTRTMDPRLDPAVYGAGGIVPSAQGLLTSQLPQAQAAGQQMMNVGSGLLGQPIAGNGVNQVHLNAPTTSTNPYLGGMADDIARRTQTLLGQNNHAIQGAFVGSGGLGGSRQGIAQGTAAGQAADSLQGQLANLYGTQYSQDQNRALQQYGLDQNFYGQQRGQDLTGAGVGSSLIGQGLNAGWQPIQNASSAISPFTGYGTTTNSSSSGGGWQGAVGGALGAAQLAKNFGWWG
jgi:hypothetical protein